MSIRAVERVWHHSEAKGSNLLVLLAIADNFSDDTGIAFPSVKHLAQKTRLSERTVRYCLDVLLASDELTRLSRGGRRGPRHHASEYRVEVDRLSAKPDRLQRQGLPQMKSPPTTGKTQPTTGKVRHDHRQPVATQPSVEPSVEPSVISRETSPLSFLLAELIASNGSKPPEPSKKWADAERLMLSADGRDRAEAERLIRWCQDDTFWRGVILSMPNFRKHYDAIRLQHERNAPRPRRGRLVE